ncbi:PIG-L family deacetylase [Paenibacillus sp. LMG 31461]|uniref:PIG-L family deacetylase n=1 Tax=Paenibacillus plantarum TaxID=2654975 RepID=A0ABX1XAI5_9BACL|nr:PIG-L deacetylase family protein [Paenibacillus plantarum]NOU65396.1 PIG-L family deacetylase [Paenibacillus plantarum]
MRILAIGAHPDDVELCCGGTLAKYAGRGDQVTILIATNGNVGSPTLTMKEIADVRYKEAQASADVIGADLIWLNYDDEFLFHNRESRMTFINAIRKANPDVMLVHSNNDYHPDHRICSEISIDCRIPVTVPLIVTEYPAMVKIPHVFMYDNVGGIDFQPEAYVDITDTIQTKAKMLKCHASQDIWLQHMYGSDIVANMVRTSSFRGQGPGVKYAEGFRSLPMFPIPGGAHLLP